MQLLKVVATETPVIKIAGQAFPLDMLPADLRRRWDSAQSRAANANTPAERATICEEITKMTSEIAGTLAPHAVLRAAPRRSLFGLGMN